MKIVISLFLALFILAGCSKDGGQLAPPDPCKAVTFVFTDNRDTIIHWHKVCGEELERMKSYPEFSIEPCTKRIQQIVFSPVCKQFNH